jgi:hypothetical protein
MDDGFEPLESFRIGKKIVDSAFRSTTPSGAAPGKAASISGAPRPAVELMNDLVSADHRHAGGLEHLGGGGFSHSDGTGQADDNHPCASMSAMTRSRRVLVTSGLTCQTIFKSGHSLVKQHSKPVDSRVPDLRAIAMIGVTKGT